MTVAHLVRAHDPLSSVLAAERTPLFVGKQHDRIMAALSRGPATAHEIEAITGLTVVQADRRLPELLKSGKARVVQVNGEDLMRGGARVWEAV